MAELTAKRTGTLVRTRRPAGHRFWAAYRFLAALSLAGLPVFATPPSQGLAAAPKSVLTGADDFDRTDLMDAGYKGNSVSGFSFLNPNRFSMRQSYSVGMSSGSFGTQSAGLYLNTLSYRLADPLTLSADIGFHTPFYSSFGGPSAGFQNPGLGSSLVLPRIGLEYRPSEHTSFSLQILNGPDAAKAYGYPGTSLWNPWNR
jgi:hypothetical protein